MVDEAVDGGEGARFELGAARFGDAVGGDGLVEALGDGVLEGGDEGGAVDALGRGDLGQAIAVQKAIADLVGGEVEEIANVLDDLGVARDAVEAGPSAGGGVLGEGGGDGVGLGAVEGAGSDEVVEGLVGAPEVTGHRVAGVAAGMNGAGALAGAGARDAAEDEGEGGDEGGERGQNDEGGAVPTSGRVVGRARHRGLLSGFRAAGCPGDRSDRGGETRVPRVGW